MSDCSFLLSQSSISNIEDIEDYEEEPPNNSCRRYCFTFFNYTSEDLDFIKDACENNAFVSYLIFQEEICPTTDREHLQGFVMLKKPMKYKTIQKKIFNNKVVNFLKARGTADQNISYCSKITSRKPNGVTYIFGEVTKQGQRTDLLKVKALIDSGATEKQLWDEHFPIMVPFFKGILRYKTVKSKLRDFKTTVTVLYGPTNTGKSSYCLANSVDSFWKQRGNWWCLYNEEETVVIDEFYGWLPYDTLLRLCDRYPMMVEVKGGQVNFNSKHIFITSNKRPQQWYKDVYFDSFIRRVEKWVHVPRLGVYNEFTDYNDFCNAIGPIVNLRQ